MSWIYNRYVVKGVVLCLIILFPLYFRNCQLLSHENKSQFLITIPIHVRFRGPGFRFPDLIEATQLQINEEIVNLLPENWKLELIDDLNNAERRLEDNGTTLELQYTVELIHDQNDSVGIDSEDLLAYMFYSLKSIHNNDLPFNLAQIVIYHLMSAEQSMINSELTDNLSIRFILEKPQSELRDLIKVYLDKFSGIITYTFREDMLNIKEDLVVYVGNNPGPVDQNITIIDDVAPLATIADLIESKLNFPYHPSNNVNLKITSFKRLKTIQNLTKLKNMSAGLLLIEDITNNPMADWSKYLAQSEAILEQHN